MIRSWRHTNTFWLLGLLVAAMLMATPILAVAGQWHACDGRCCCTAPLVSAAPVLSGQAATDCCHAGVAPPCQMSTGEQPQPLMAWIQSSHRIQATTIHASFHTTGISPPSPPSAQLTMGNGPFPVRDHSSLYLEIRRLIC